MKKQTDKKPQSAYELLKSKMQKPELLNTKERSITFEQRLNLTKK